jgi:hypothetical protein
MTDLLRHRLQHRRERLAEVHREHLGTITHLQAEGSLVPEQLRQALDRVALDLGCYDLVLALAGDDPEAAARAILGLVPAEQLPAVAMRLLAELQAEEPPGSGERR